MADLETDISKIDTDLVPKIDTKTAEANLGYQAKIVIGGSDPNKCIPNVNCSFERKLPDEFYLNVNAKNVTVPTDAESADFTVDKITEINSTDRKDRFYVDVDGNLEYEIVLAKKPVSNVIELEIKHSAEVSWHRQPSLSEQFAIFPDGCKTIEEYAKIYHVPDDIAGAYVAICNRRDNQYQTGILATIKRPKLIDANGVERWATQTITPVSESQAQLQIECNFDGLTWPVIVDPTIGYTTIGGGVYIVDDRCIVVADSNYAAGATGGTASKIYVALKNESGNAWDKSIDLGYYSDDSGEPNNLIAHAVKSSNFSSSDAGEWNNVDVSGTITANAKHYPAVGIGSGNGGVAYAWVNDIARYFTSSSTLPDPWTSASTTGLRLSVYIDWSESAGTTIPPLAMNHYRQLRT